ncbi:glycerophosphodiester phosphodiesterase [Roseimaritima ulvae]|uniref:Putative glycerophosphoryl diester phosphodiesterase 1 n=1 Tax=Roseimaritima ulvae TaxID=980254 RepID=A0A5B9QUU9_9BACT|nr:glycerophosphodiester phosphodiesterase [Roseimaritima ulvae]QEG41749.1 putative glycerophosphoryl diester phosphodiesterase 1 [Roseimaritima ulvae]
MRYLIATFALLLPMFVTESVMGQKIVAHRGASFDAPENTLAAFRQAWQQQADAIEGDFYLTSDGQIVCIHDKTTKRVAPQQPVLQVAKSTLAELRALDVGSWKDPRYQGETIPTLQEVLATIPAGKQIFVEIKCGPEILPELKKQLTASGLAAEQIVIIAFDQAVVRGARRMMPQYKANWLTSYKQNKVTTQWTPSRSRVLEILQQTSATGLGTQGNLEVLGPKFVDAVHQAGKEFHVWTVNDADPARTLAGWGADSLTTDRPAFIRQAITQEAAKVEPAEPVAG